MSVSAEENLPMFMRPDGEKKIEERRKELQVYLNILNSEQSNSVLKDTAILLNPHSIHDGWVGKEEADVIKKWWNDGNTWFLTNHWLLTNKHKISGNFGNWSNGSMGSRWADTDINGRNCRIAFYTRKKDPSMFPAETNGVLDEKNYILMIDPTL